MALLGRESFNKDIRGAGNVSINWHKLKCTVFLKIGSLAIGGMAYTVSPCFGYVGSIIAGTSTVS